MCSTNRELQQAWSCDLLQGRVLRFDSCSKFLAPGFRIGWAALPPLLASKLGMAQFASSLGPTPFSQVHIRSDRKTAQLLLSRKELAIREKLLCAKGPVPVGNLQPGGPVCHADDVCQEYH